MGVGRSKHMFIKLVGGTKMVKPNIQLSAMTVMNLCIALAVGLIAAPAIGQEAGREFPLVFGNARIVETPTLANPLDGVVGPGGRVCVADFTESNVRCREREGAAWITLGRRGDGPGEFRSPYRLAFTPRNQLWVWDFATQEASLFDSTGRFISRHRLPYRFRQVDNLLAIGENDLLVAGVSSVASEMREHALHIFRRGKLGDPLSVVRAFGRLPPAKVRQKLEQWGAGNATWSSRGTIYHSLRVPYEISEYGLEGALVRRIEGPVLLGVGPDRAVYMTEANDEVTIGRSESETIVYPLRAYDVGTAWILTGRRTSPPKAPGEIHWDLLDRRTGKLVASSTPRAGLKGLTLFGFDASSWTMWGFGDSQGEDVIMTVKVEPRNR